MQTARRQPTQSRYLLERGRAVRWWGHGMADDAKLRTASGLSALWDGAAIKRVRVDGTTILPDRRLSAHLMMQPDVAAGWLSDRVLADQGLLSRVLVSAPGSNAGIRFWREWSENGALGQAASMN